MVCLNDSLTEINTYVEEKYPNDRKSLNTPAAQPTQQVEVVGVNSQTTDDLIPIFRNKVKRDFVCMSCDFITDVEPETLLDHHRNRHKDTIITGIHYKNNIETLDKKVLKPDLLVHTSFKNKSPLILDLYSRDAIAQKKSLRLRDAMIIRHANSVVSTDVLHSSINFCSHKLIDILTDGSNNQNTSSGNMPSASAGDNNSILSGSNTPNAAYSSGSSSSVGNLSSKSDLLSSGYCSLDNKNVAPIHLVPIKGRPWTKIVRDIARRSWQHSKPLETVALALVEGESTFIRIESLPSYMEANRWIMKQKARTTGSTRPTTATKGAAAVGADSLVGTDTVLGERTSIKKSVVGNNCILGKRCRLNGCIVLDGAKIGDDVQLESCLIGKKAIINTKCRLTHCTIEGGYEIAKETQAKDENFEGFEIEGEDDDYAMGYSVSRDDSEDSNDDDNDDDDSGEESEYSDGRDKDEDDDGFFDRS